MPGNPRFTVPKILTYFIVQVIEKREYPLAKSKGTKPHGFDTAYCTARVTITAFRGLVARANVQVGERAAVVGCGGVGLEAFMITVRPQRKQLAYNPLGRKVKMKILIQYGRWKEFGLESQ